MVTCGHLNIMCMSIWKVSSDKMDFLFVNTVFTVRSLIKYKLRNIIFIHSVPFHVFVVVHTLPLMDVNDGQVLNEGGGV